MLNLSVIILTYNEEIHIRRCVENVKGITDKVFVVDCFSTDKTVELATGLGAEVVMHEWPGNQADQFNWALDNIPINTEWVLRLDADEYLSEGLISEFNVRLPDIDKSISAVTLSLGRAFMGKILKHGIVNDVKMIRLFRRGKARYEKRLMDEHLLVLEGSTIAFHHKFIDDNRNSLKYFIDKHNGYSSREAALLLDAEYDLTQTDYSTMSAEYCEDVKRKRTQKKKYAKLPLFWRAFAYFIYRYIFKLGFLDGKEGFLWDFLQGLWYRMLVDAKIFEIKKACGNDKEKILSMLRDKYNISI